MSKYTEHKTCVTVKDKELLIEALIRIWKDIYGRDLRETDIEFHDEAVPLLGFEGDVRGVSSKYGAQLGNVIVRGDGLDSAIRKKDTAALKATGWTGESRNVHNGAYNDWALRLTEDGYYVSTVTDYDPGQKQKKLNQMLLSTITALKIEKQIKALNTRPDYEAVAILMVEGQPDQEIGLDQIGTAVQVAALSGGKGLIKIKMKKKKPGFQLPKKKKKKKKKKESFQEWGYEDPGYESQTAYE